MSQYAQQLQRCGFRRWYERRLLYSHAYLAWCVLALVMVTASLKGLSLARLSVDQVTDLTVVFASGASAVWACKKHHPHFHG